LHNQLAERFSLQSRVAI